MSDFSVPLSVSPSELFSIIVDSPLEVTGATPEVDDELDGPEDANAPTPYVPAIGGGPWAETMRAIRAETLARVNGVIGLPVRYPNAPFQQPTDSSWVDLSVQTSETERLEVGGSLNLFRQTGSVVFGVRTRSGGGDAAALAVADQLFDQFVEIESSTVRFGLPAAGAAAEDGKWLLTEVDIPFQSDVELPSIERGFAIGDGTIEGFTNTIRDRMHQGLGVGNGLSSQFDSAPFQPREDQSWVRFSVRRGKTVRRELGGGAAVVTPGVAFAQIFGRLETGDSQLNDYADAVSEVFRAVSVRGITFRVPNVRPLGVSGRWWQVNVSCPFFSQRILS